jgi:predicted MFS family arabinose efflux permease
MALGPVAGGLLIGAAGWRSIFWLNVPCGLAAMILTRLFVPSSRAERGRRLDPAGQLLVIVALASATYAIIEAPAAGWLSVRTFVLAAVALAALWLFVRYELRRAEPLIDPRLFLRVQFTGATLMAVLGFAMVAGFLFMNTLYLQDALGWSALKAGLFTLPIAAGTTLASPLSGRVTGARGPRAPLAVAGTLLTVSALLLTRLGPSAPVTLLTVAYFALGLGFGALNPPITNTAVSGMPREQAGVAAAVASTSRQVGQTVGVAVVGSVVMSQVHGSLRAGLPAASHAGLWILAGCGLAVLVLGMLTTDGRFRRVARAPGDVAPGAGAGRPAAAGGGGDGRELQPGQGGATAGQRADADERARGAAGHR